MPNPTQRLVNFLRTLFAVILLLLGGLSGAALAAPTTPTTDFTDNGDGTVTHKTTGLTWKRCSEGQTWTGSTCSGTAIKYPWEQAVAITTNFAGKEGWRLPTIDELFTIVEYDKANPAINTTIFPSTPTQYFWSASIYATDPVSARSMDFSVGAAGYAYTRYSNAVRLVRGGQSLVPLASYTPTSDFTDHANGTVTHKKTGLMWKRCAEGLTWTGTICSGTAIATAWARATMLSSNFGGYTDWRLPTANELLSIVEWSTTAPAINSAIFPTASSTYFWSTSVYATAPAAAWIVNFSNGDAYGDDKIDVHAVRLVRGGQPVSPSLHGPDCLFNWAEGYAPTGFSPAGSASQTIGTYYYRAYAKSGSYLASSSDGNLYYLDKSSGLLNLGPLTQWYATAGCQP